MATLLAAILAFFVFPSVGFFIGLLALSVVYTIATERDIHGFAIFATVLGVALFWSTISLAFAAWHLLLIGAAAYALAGGAWSVFRWFKYCREYIVNHPYNSPVSDYSGGKEVRLTATEYYKKELRPGKHKSRLIGWIAYWPWSLIWNIAGDTLTAIYDALANVYQRTADAVIKKALGSR